MSLRLSFGIRLGAYSGYAFPPMYETEARTTVEVNQTRAAAAIRHHLTGPRKQQLWV